MPLWAKLLLPAVRRYHDRRIASALDGSYGRGLLPTSEEPPDDGR